MTPAEATFRRWNERAVQVYLLGFFAFFPMSGALRGGALPKVVVMSAIGVAAWDVVSRWARLRVGAGELLLLAFGLWYVLAIAASPFPVMAKETMVTVFGWPVVVLGMAQLLMSGARVRSAILGYVLGATGGGIWGIVNVATGKIATVQIEGQDVNDLGFYTSTGAVLAIGLWSSRRVGARARVAGAVCAAVLVVAVLGSLSRGSTAGLLLGIAVFAALNRHARASLARGAIVALVAVIAATPVWLPRFQASAKMKSHVAGENVSSRLDAWGIGASLGVENPLSGVGPSTIAPYVMRHDHTPPGGFVVHVAHNTVVEALYGTGVVGLALLALAAAAAFHRTFQATRLAGGRLLLGARPGAVVHAALWTALVCSMFTTQTFNPTMWLVLALGYAGGAPELPHLGLGRSAPRRLRAARRSATSP